MSPVALLVAVAVTTCTLGTLFLVLKMKVASPLSSVVTLFWPKNLLPLPSPEGSAKNWTVKVSVVVAVLGVLYSAPLTVVPLRVDLAEISSG